MGRFSGIALPFDGSAALFVQPKPDREIIRTSLRLIILTMLGERVMLPEFGTRIYERVFEPNDPQLEGIVFNEIVSAIRVWDTRVDILKVRTKRNEHNLIITIYYKIHSDERDEAGQYVDVEVPVSRV